MAADPNKLTGKAMYFTLGGTNIKITSATPKATPKLADCTDTGNFNVAADLLFPQQIPTSLGIEFSIEGYFYKTQTGSAVIAKLFDGAGGPYAVTFGPLSGYGMFSGNYDISDFQVTSQTEETVKFTASLKSNGVITAS